MTKDMVSTFMCQLENDSIGDAENSYEKIYRLVLEALTNGTTEETKKKISSLYPMLDQVEETMDWDSSQNSEQIRTYYMGQIKALADLLADADRRQKTMRESEELFERYRYLASCLKIIDEHPRITGIELRHRLHIRSANSLSNFMKRIEPYQLLHVQRVGNTNYYMLSPKGRRYLQENRSAEKSSGMIYDEKFVLLLLDAISNELKRSKPSAARVVSQVNLRSNGCTVRGNSLMLRSHIDQVFKVRFQVVKKALSQEPLSLEEKPIAIDYPSYKTSSRKDIKRTPIYRVIEIDTSEY